MPCLVVLLPRQPVLSSLLFTQVYSSQHLNSGHQIISLMMLGKLEATSCTRQVDLQASAIRASPIAEVIKDLDDTADLQAAFKQAAPMRKDFRRCAPYSSRATATSRLEHQGLSVPNMVHDGQHQLQGLIAHKHQPPKGKRGGFTIFEGSHGDSITKTAPMRKEPRRRTIYVPSEDTSILTIHPGGIYHAQPLPANASVTRVAMDAQKGRHLNGRNLGPHGRDRSPLAAAPKRAPLQPTLKVVQEPWRSHDRPGSGPGKENIVPRTVAVQDGWKLSEAQNLEFESGCSGAGLDRYIRKFPFSTTSGEGPTGIGQNHPPRPYMKTSKHVEDSHRPARTPCHKVVHGPVKRQAGNVTLKGFLKGSTGCTEKSPKALPSRLGVLWVPQRKHNTKNTYSLLEDDIYRPEMYEEAWMSDQESALAQLINALFGAAGRGEDPVQNTEHTKRRQVLLHLYQEPSTVLLFNRLQASILCGTLSVPRGSCENVCRLQHDVGFRRQFIDIWMKTFDLSCLRAAAEVVIGREVPADSKPMAEQHVNHPPTTQMLKRHLEIFIDKCLLRNEDSLTREESQSINGLDFGSTLWCQQRTVLRSLMMIFLLDKAKELQLVKENLFLRTSKFKSTEKVLEEISQLLLPCVGDINRSLGRLGLRASHVQYPLHEYDYRVHSLATAFRDGVRLTRLVELLLHPPDTLKRLDKDVTVIMPTGEVLTTAISDHESWVLSQHLIFPCIGRPQKLHNVQVALSALRGVQGIEQIMGKVSAEDFVDGHRERTMIMLWGLVGKWGLGTLVDCTDLNKEVFRLQSLQDNTDNQMCVSNQGDESDYEPNLEGPEKHTRLLKAWAQNIAQLHGLTVSNLTTSFADGSVFKAIVDEYEHYLPFAHLRIHAHIDETGQLAPRLRRIGCSASFGKILCSR